MPQKKLSLLCGWVVPSPSKRRPPGRSSIIKPMEVLMKNPPKPQFIATCAPALSDRLGPTADDTKTLRDLRYTHQPYLHTFPRVSVYEVMQHSYHQVHHSDHASRVAEQNQVLLAAEASRQPSNAAVSIVVQQQDGICLPMGAYLNQPELSVVVEPLLNSISICVEIHVYIYIYT